MPAMTSKQRLLTAIEGGKPDRLPVTTHSVMPYFLDTYMKGISNQEFFDHFALDSVVRIAPLRPDESEGQYLAPDNCVASVVSDDWRIECEDITRGGHSTVRYNFVTPKGSLTMVTQRNEYTIWVTEHLVKEKSDIDLIGEYAAEPKCDVAVVNKAASDFPGSLIRGHICCFDVFGQPGTWQDASCLFGTERLIMETYDDPKWVHQFLNILQNRKKVYINSLEGAKYDILELGGGAASSTVISPKLFDEFVAAYDAELIEFAHDLGQRIVYHTCGGMMAILANVATMGPDAMETFTPAGMGGDTDLAQARRRIPNNICMIGGFDQFHFLSDCTCEETAAEVRRCFEEAGKNGSYILSPSDHFFDAEPELIKAFADEARKCVY